MDRSGIYQWLGQQGRRLDRKVVIAGRQVDLASQDGRAIYEVKLRGRGVRELREGIMQLAQTLAAAPDVEQAYLIIALWHSSAKRIREEWARALAALRPGVAD